jgi:hypothetical protein
MDDEMRGDPFIRGDYIKCNAAVFEEIKKFPPPHHCVGNSWLFGVSVYVDDEMHSYNDDGTYNLECRFTDHPCITESFLELVAKFAAKEK